MNVLATLASRPDLNDDVVFAAWLQKHSRKSASTGRNYAAWATVFRDWCAAGGVGLAQVTVPHLLAFMEHLRAKYKPAGVQCRMGAVKSLLKFAHVTFPQLYPNYAGEAVEVEGAKRRPLRDWLPLLENIDAVIDGEPDFRIRTFLRTLYHTGCRIDELCGARWDDLLVTQAKGEDGKPITCYVLELRQKGDVRRTKPLDAELYNDLLNLPQPETGEPGTIFRVRVRRASAWCRRAWNRAGFPLGSAHTFRHACASHMADAGVSENQIVEAIGWEDARTLKRYLHLPEITPGEVLRKRKGAALAARLG